MDSHDITFESEFILPTLDIDFEIETDDENQGEEFDFSEFTEGNSISETNEIVPPYDPNVHLPSNVPDDSLDNYMTIESIPKKESQISDCDMDWLTSLFDNSTIPDPSGNSSEAIQGSSQISCPSNSDYNFSYCPDLFDIINESFHFGEQSNINDIPVQPVVNDKFILNNASKSTSTSQINIESNLKYYDTNISTEHYKATFQITPDFPSKTSIFNIKESQKLFENEEVTNLTMASEAFSVSSPPKSISGNLKTNNYTIPPLIVENPFNCLANDTSIPLKQSIKINTFTNEGLKPVQHTSLSLSKSVSSENITKNFRTNGSNIKTSVCEKPGNFLTNNKSFQTKQLTEKVLTKERFKPIRQISNPIQSNPNIGLSKQTDFILKYPIFINEPISSMLNARENSSTRVAKQPSAPMLLLVNDSLNQTLNKSKNYQILSESKSTRNNSSLSNIQNFLLLSNDKGEQTLMLYNNQEIHSPSPNTISKTLPISTASTTVFANVQNTGKTAQFLNISYTATPQNCIINKKQELHNKNKDVNTISKKNKKFSASSVKSIPGIKVIYPNINKSTPVSVIPLMPLTYAPKKGITETNNNQHRVAILRKLRVPSPNGPKSSFGVKNLFKSQYMDVSHASHKTGQRRKTVRELLLEQQRKKTFESLVQNCVSNSNEVHTMDVAFSFKQRFKAAGSAKSTVKPSILMLRSEKKDSPQELKSNTSLPKGNLPISHNKLAFSHKSLNLNLEEDVDDPGLYTKAASAPTVKLSTSSSGRHHLKPRHFDMYYLEIGDFKVEDAEVEKVRCKFKVLFAKKQFVYEFPLYNNGTSIPKNKMARLNIPFNVVNAINCFDQEVYLRVNTEPQVFIKAVKEKLGIDIIHCETTETTGVKYGTEVKCSIHRIVLGDSQGNKLKACLLQYDPYFYGLMCAAVKEEFSLLYAPFEVSLIPRSNVLPKRPKKDRRLSCRQLPQVDICGENSLFTLQVCSCKISCRSYRCSCVKAAQKCNTGRSVCVCSNCDNPLNILDTLGIDPICAVLDSCLFQNIYQVTHLRQYLCQEIKLPCCSYIATIQECIPGTILCPNMECMESVQYSWCLNLACSAERNPRNHCSDCGKCRFSIGIHCDKCKTCYVKKPESSWCPRCAFNPPGIAENHNTKEASPTNEFSTINNMDTSDKINEDS